MASALPRSERGFLDPVCACWLRSASAERHGGIMTLVAAVPPSTPSMKRGHRRPPYRAAIDWREAEHACQSWRGGVRGSSLRAGGKRLSGFGEKGSMRGTDKGSVREGDGDSVGRAGTGLRRIGDEGSMRGANKGLVGQGR